MVPTPCSDVPVGTASMPPGHVPSWSCVPSRYHPARLAYGSTPQRPAGGLCWATSRQARSCTAGDPFTSNHEIGTVTGIGGGGGGTNTGRGTVNSPGTRIASLPAGGIGEGGIVTIPQLYVHFAGPPEAARHWPSRLTNARHGASHFTARNRRTGVGAPALPSHQLRP
jgi:hypothetical protein